MRSNQRRRITARSSDLLADQAGSARLAASMATAASLAPRSGTVAISSPVAGSVTAKILAEVTHSPLINAAVGNLLEIKFIVTSPSAYRNRDRFQVGVFYEDHAASGRGRSPIA